jgi:hypothetical protein
MKSASPLPSEKQRPRISFWPGWLLLFARRFAAAFFTDRTELEDGLLFYMSWDAKREE